MVGTTGGSSSNEGNVGSGSRMAGDKESSRRGVRLRTVGGSSSVCGEANDETEKVMRVSKRLVKTKWRVLKLCSQVLDESEGWESNEMERVFTQRQGGSG